MTGIGIGISIGSATPMDYWGKSVFCTTAQQREVDAEWEILVSICGVCVCPHVTMVTVYNKDGDSLNLKMLRRQK